MRSLTIGLILAVTVALSGCSAFSKEYPDKRYFSLHVVRSGEERVPLDNLVLKVRQFEVSRSYEGQELIYRQGELDWASDYYNALFVPPADLLTEATIRWIEASRLFAQVVPQTSRLKPTHYLEGFLASFYGDYSDPANRRAVVEIGFLLMDERNLDSLVAYQGVFKREEPLADDSVEELIRAYERAIAGILSELDAGLDKGLR